MEINSKYECNENSNTLINKMYWRYQQLNVNALICENQMEIAIIVTMT